MFARLGRLICRFPWLFVALATLVVGMAAGFGVDVMRHLTLAPGWDVPNSGSELAFRHLRDRLGKDETPVIVLFRAGPVCRRMSTTRPSARRRKRHWPASARIPTCPAWRATTATPMPLRSAKGDMTYALIKLRLAADEGMAPSSACARSCAAIAW